MPFLLLVAAWTLGKKTEGLRRWKANRRVRRDEAIVTAHKEIYGRENP